MQEKFIQLGSVISHVKLFGDDFWTFFWTYGNGCLFYHQLGSDYQTFMKRKIQLHILF